MSQIPHLVRHNIYAFVPYVDLLNLIQKLSRKDRESIVNSDVLDQTRVLFADFNKSRNIKLDQISYAVKLCKSIVIKIDQIISVKSEGTLSKISYLMRKARSNSK
jgi:hypothetical protein